jgi:hypothetical protein
MLDVTQLGAGGPACLGEAPTLSCSLALYAYCTNECLNIPVHLCHRDQEHRYSGSGILIRSACVHVHVTYPATW